MYPEPHFAAAEEARSLDEIRRLGFVPDPWLGHLETPVLGLNVAVQWPLPAAFRAEYDRMRGALERLDAGVYVYPFEETHVTVATLVSFKRHERPADGDHERLMERVPWVARVLDEITGSFRGFEIDVGAPVLVRSAAFLPIRNPTGEIKKVRDRLANERNEWPEMQIPQGLHSTVLRVRREPLDSERFIDAFRAIAASVRFGVASVDELMVTTETRPYMLEGRIVHKSHVGGLPQSARG